MEETTATITQATTPLPTSPAPLLFSAAGSKAVGENRAEVAAANSAEVLIASVSRTEVVSSLENSKKSPEEALKPEELRVENNTKAKSKPALLI